VVRRGHRGRPVGGERAQIDHELLARDRDRGDPGGLAGG
jgi:hypothetical protein